VAAGQTYTETVKFRNTGESTWSVSSNGYALTAAGPNTSSAWNVTPVPLATAAATDQEVEFVVTLTAPLATGTHPLQFRLQKNGVPFGAISVTVPVQVQ
jgi:hypothetical protein